MKKITAIIPVRKGSQRIINKNIRKFYNSNLLTIKINFLKKVKNIDEIIVSSDCDKMLKIAEDLGINTHKRDKYYASSECPNHKYWKYLAENVGKHDNVMMVNCTSPFIDNNIIEDILKIYNNKDKLYDGIVTINSLKKFLWFTDTYEPVNYLKNKTPNSQDLKSVGEITFGVCISSRENIIKTSSIFGIKPYLYEVDSINSIDIDNSEDFIISDLLYKKNLLNKKKCDNYLEIDSENIKILDSTIKDGGYTNNWNFDIEVVKECYKSVSEAGIDFFEIGFRSSYNILDRGKWFYSNDEDISKIKNSCDGCKIAVMCEMGDFNITDFKEKKYSDIDFVRLLIPRNNLYTKNLIDSSSTMIDRLLSLGYDVAINIQNISHISNEEINIICSGLHNKNIKCIYLEDSYGNTSESLLLKIIMNFQDNLNKTGSKIKLGFHGHDNLSNALNNSILSINRNIKYIDCTISGIGKGGGNLATELLLYNLNNKYSKKYNIHSILELINRKIIKGKYKIEYFFYYISGILNIHPNYIQELFNNKLELKQIYNYIYDITKYCNEKNNYSYNKNLINYLIQ